MIPRSVPDRLTDALDREFSNPELQTLGRRGTLIQVTAGQELDTVDPKGDEVFVVVSGTAEVSYRGLPCGSIGVGAVFGQGALAASAPPQMCVTATTALSVFRFGSAAFSQVLAESPRLKRNMRDLVARRAANR